jgi:hypothetical protein
MDELHILLVYSSPVYFLISTRRIMCIPLITYEVTPILPKLYRVDNENRR